MARVLALSAFALLAPLALVGSPSACAAGDEPDFVLAPLASPAASSGNARLLPPLELIAAPAAEEIPPPRNLEPASLPQQWGALPITLMVALRLTPNTNLDVGQAQQNIVQARAPLLRASA